MSADNYYQPELETISADDLAKLQLQRLQATVRNCYDNIDFYKQSFNEAGIKPADIQSLADLSKIPFTTKQDMRDAYPFDLFAIGAHDPKVARLHASSGTTGNATVVGYTQSDLDVWGDCFARNIVMAGGSSESILHVSYGYGLFTGGLGAHEGGVRLGATILPMSSGNTKRQVQMMKDFGSDILCCTPSYALLIADTAIEMGYNPKDFRLHGAVLGAEPCSDTMRKEIEDKLGVLVVDIYGLSEVMGPGVSCECKYQNGLHIAEDHFLTEIINPDTLEPVPDGEWGEVVFTTLSKECSPILRYRTRDISRIIPGNCKCGRTLRRMDRISGRSDDMLIIRGVNVFPTQIQEVIGSFAEVTNHYQIILTRKGPLDHIELQVEPVETFAFDEIKAVESLRQRLNADLKSVLQVAVDIKIVEPKTIERSEGKAKRVLDLREK